MANEIINRIESFLRQNLANILQHEGEDEPDLLRKIDFAESLGLEKDHSSTPALFGYSTLRTDYQPQNDGNTIIEVKRLGLISKRTGKVRENECDFKNGVAQILEQAQCKNAQNAILVVLDGGRSSNRDWNQQEIRYIRSMGTGFTNISFFVIRARIEKDPQQIQIQIIPPNRTS